MRLLDSSFLTLSKGKILRFFLAPKGVMRDKTGVFVPSFFLDSEIYVRAPPPAPWETIPTPSCCFFFFTIFCKPFEYTAPTFTHARWD